MLETYPNSTLRASGENVGLKPGKAGNSEAGHSNLGAGRVVAQDDVGRGIALDRDGSYGKIQRACECFTRGAGTQYRMERIKMKE